MSKICEKEAGEWRIMFLDYVQKVEILCCSVNVRQCNTANSRAVARIFHGEGEECTPQELVPNN